MYINFEYLDFINYQLFSNENLLFFYKSKF